jgi:hypothetical protein
MKSYIVRAHTDSGVLYMGFGYDLSGKGRRGIRWFPEQEDSAMYTNAESAQQALNDCMDKGHMPHAFRDQDIQEIDA